MEEQSSLAAFWGPEAVGKQQLWHNVFLGGALERTGGQNAEKWPKSRVRVCLAGRRRNKRKAFQKERMIEHAGSWGLCSTVSKTPVLCRGEEGGTIQHLLSIHPVPTPHTPLPHAGCEPSMCLCAHTPPSQPPPAAKPSVTVPQSFVTNAPSRMRAANKQQARVPASSCCRQAAERQTGQTNPSASLCQQTAKKNCVALCARTHSTAVCALLPVRHTH